MNNRLLTLLEIALLVGLVLVVMYLGGVFKTEPDPTLTPLSATSTPFPTSFLTPTLAPTPTAPPLTQPTGLIAFTSNRDGDADIYLMDANGNNLHNLTDNFVDDYLISWSPDGRKIAYFSTGGYFAWPEIYVLDVEKALQGANDYSIQITNTVGSRTAYRLPVAWSPDGQYLLASGSYPFEIGHYPPLTFLDLIPVNGVGATTIHTSGEDAVQELSISTDGQYIAALMNGYAGNGLYVSEFDEPGYFWLVAPFCQNHYVWYFKNNTLVCAYGGVSTLYVYNLAGVLLEEIDAFSRDYGDIHAMLWSPDGSSLLVNYASWEKQGGIPRKQMFALTSDGGSSWLTPYADEDILPDEKFGWAPDNQWITFASKKDGQANIYILNVYSGSDPLQLTRNAVDNYSPQWQPASP